jgi:hypothetical protein
MAFAQVKLSGGDDINAKRLVAENMQQQVTDLEREVNRLQAEIKANGSKADYLIKSMKASDIV